MIFTHYDYMNNNKDIKKHTKLIESWQKYYLDTYNSKLICLNFGNNYKKEIYDFF